MTLTLDRSPYISDGFTVTNDATLTIEHGVVIKFNQGATMNVGWGDPGYLIAKGVKTLPNGQQVADPIHLLASLPNPTHGYWKGVSINGGQYRSVLDHIIISNAGLDKDAALRVKGGTAPTITNCSISWSDGPGVDASDRDAGFTKFSGNSVSHCGGSAMVVSPLAAGGITSDNHFQNNARDLIEVAGDLQVDSHWTNHAQPFLVTDNIHATGKDNHTATLTLDPGVKLMFQPNTGLQFGWGDDVGQLVAQGTADQPVVFTSAKPTPAPGDWNGIKFDTGGKSVMDHCVVEYAGGTDHNAQVWDAGGTPSITNCIVRNGSGAGVSVDNEDANHLVAFKGNTVTANHGAALDIYDRIAGEVDTDNHLTGNGDDVIKLSTSEINADMEWHAHDVPYYLPDSVTINSPDEGNEVTLTLDPGVHILFGDNAVMNLGWGNKGSLKAVGTADNPIVFSSHEKAPAKGDWRGLSFGDSGGSTDLEYVEIDYAGPKDGEPVIHAGDNARGKIDHYTIAHSAAPGIKVSNSKISQQDGTFNDVDGDHIVSD